MADLNSVFKTFHAKIVLPSGKEESLRKGRNAIRDQVRKYFRENIKVAVPKFQGQGSYAMGTITNPLDGEFDIDDGVYLQHLDEKDSSRWPTADTVHSWLIKATDGHTDETPIDKRCCVRIRYAGHYHVDLPSYAKFNGKYVLAEKGAKPWPPSDPLDLTLWFKKLVKLQGEQLLRVVRYIKAWVDFQSGRRDKMPSGLTLTVLATQYFSADERDDVSSERVAQAISNAVNPVFSVFNPVDSEEELTAKLTGEQKVRFQKAISDLAADAAAAIKTGDREKASKIWRRQLGDRFPATENRIEVGQNREDAAKVAGIFAAQNPSKPWGYR